MQYSYSETIDYWWEAVYLTAIHYGPEGGCEGWMLRMLQERRELKGYLEPLMQPLCEIEKEVFTQCAVGEADAAFYFTGVQWGNKEPTGTKEEEEKPAGMSLAELLTAVWKRFPEGGAQRWKKAFAEAVWESLEYEEADAPMTETEFFHKLKETEMSSQMRWNCMDVYLDLEGHMKRLREILGPVIGALKKQEKRLKALILENPERKQPYYVRQGVLQLDEEIREVEVISLVFRFQAVMLYIYKEQQKQGRAKLYYGFLVDRLVQASRQGEQAAAELAEAWKSLADKSRLRILGLLRSQELCGQDLKEALGLSNATISHHMNALLLEELVHMCKKGTKVYYRINREKIEAVLEDMRRMLLGE